MISEEFHPFLFSLWFLSLLAGFAPIDYLRQFPTISKASFPFNTCRLDNICQLLCIIFVFFRVIFKQAFRISPWTSLLIFSKISLASGIYPPQGQEPKESWWASRSNASIACTPPPLPFCVWSLRVYYYRLLWIRNRMHIRALCRSAMHVRLHVCPLCMCFHIWESYFYLGLSAACKTIIPAYVVLDLRVLIVWNRVHKTESVYMSLLSGHVHTRRHWGHCVYNI